MPVKVLIPTPLRSYTENQEVVEANGRTVGDVLRELGLKYSRLTHHLFSEDGTLRSYVNVYLNNEDIRYLQGEQTLLKDTDVISIIPSIAGGSFVNEKGVLEEIQLSHEEIFRYSRHLIMPEVGMEGQKKLKAASVLMIGAGGLGSPLALYLAAAGIGRLGIVDFDTVDQSNLQRQLLYTTQDIGRSKIQAARERISSANPNVVIETYETRLTSENAEDILKMYDVIVDGTDNFPTRYLVNDACVLLGKPNVYGSIFRFDGQVSVFYAREGPCYRCLYPEPPPPGLVPSCAEGGVLGVLPGIIGSLQALETIKLIIGKGNHLIGRLLLLDALKMEFRELRLRRNPRCPVCGENPSIHELIDYEEFCGVTWDEIGPAVGAQYEITPEELKTWIDQGREVFILDVREPQEYNICNLGGYLIPLGELPRRVHELDSAREMVVHCHYGSRSAQAVEFLKQAGFRKIKNLVGGIDAWAKRIDKKIPIY